MTSALQGRRVAVGVGGGIAAYKACELVRELMRAGAEVRVALTPAAQQFVTPLTFQNLTRNPVLTDYFDVSQEATFGHIELARWAELFVLAPATADLIARVRAGMANDAVTTSLLAFDGPVLVAPSMNTVMWLNEITQANVRALKAQPRFVFAAPAAGELACGEVGEGRLAEVPRIVELAAGVFGTGPLRGKKVLITAGPTREYFDPVRFLSNPSTGKMGLAIAQAARVLGAEVTVVLGPVDLAAPTGVSVVPVVSAEEMAQAVRARVGEADYFVASAAVSDWKPKTRLAHKVKKEGELESIELVRTPDVLAEASAQVHSAARRPVLIGFAAETEKVVEHARGKLERKRLDWIVANDVTAPGAGFAVETNRVLLIGRSGEPRRIEGTKLEVARALWQALLPAEAK